MTTKADELKKAVQAGQMGVDQLLVELAKLGIEPDEQVDYGPVGAEGEVVEFEARGAVIKLFECRDDEVVLSGPAGTGKSMGCLSKVHYLLMTTRKAKALLVRKTLVSLTNTGLVTYQNEILHRLDGVHFFGGSKSKPAQFVYPNGSTADVIGLDQITKVMSSQYDVIYVQEENELTEAEHEMLTTRLRNGVLPFQQLIADVNPQEQWHWILQRVGRGVMTMFESRHEDNPRLFHADGTMTHDGEIYIRRLDNLTGVRLARLRFGRWVSAEGAVYEDFDRNIHIVEPFKIPPDWTRIRSIDFGFVNPFVCQWWAIDKDGRMYLYREWYRTQTIVSDHAKRIKLLSGKHFFEATIADHDSEDRATLHAEGIKTIRARKQIVPGIEAVQRRLRPDGTGRPRLFILSDALVNREAELAETGKPVCLSEEMQTYAWASEVKGKLPKEVPLDLNNHACDAMRYAAMYLEKKVRSVAPGGVSGGGSKWVNKHARDADARFG